MCEKVSEKTDKSQGMEYATRGHWNQGDSLNKCLRAMRGLTRRTWEGLWHEGVKQELAEQDQKGQGQQRSEDWTVRKELAEAGQEQAGGDIAETATLGKNEHRKAHCLKKPGRKGKFQPSSGHYQIFESSSRKKIPSPVCNWFIWGIQMPSVSPWNPTEFSILESKCQSLPMSYTAEFFHFVFYSSRKLNTKFLLQYFCKGCKVEY